MGNRNVLFPSLWPPELPMKSHMLHRAQTEIKLRVVRLFCLCCTWLIGSMSFKHLQSSSAWVRYAALFFSALVLESMLPYGSPFWSQRWQAQACDPGAWIWLTRCLCGWAPIPNLQGLKLTLQPPGKAWPAPQPSGLLWPPSRETLGPS